ncbi:integrase core domain-containing protein [Burkholderia sp. Ed8]|uniref:integrase core domain-containing protein n=1 Tax=Burkholderia sp. Ed8 TaxID=3112957 RepID=UPI00345D31A6
MACGLVYLTAVVDWASRKVLSHRSPSRWKPCSRITGSRVRPLRAAGHRQHGSGQPVHGGHVHQGRVGWGIRLSMDGKGSWRDTMFVERVWRSVKSEEVYLKVYESVSHARRSIGEYIELYNRKRCHAWRIRRPMRHTSRRCLRSNRQHDRPRRST